MYAPRAVASLLREKRNSSSLRPLLFLLHRAILGGETHKISSSIRNDSHTKFVYNNNRLLGGGRDGEGATYGFSYTPYSHERLIETYELTSFF